MEQANAQMTMTPERLEAFGAELDAIRKRVMRDRGERDARYIYRMLALQRRSDLAGRALLMAGALPPAWLAGTSLVALGKILDNMEIGHNVLHGQYDWMNDPKLRSTSYEWDWACPAEHWRRSHNDKHHTLTNILGEDRDVGYGILRMTDEEPWHPRNLPQPIYTFVQMFVFEAAVAVHDLELDRLWRREKSARAVARDAKLVVRKAGRQVLKDYVLFPLLAGPSAPAVLLGNLTANVVRNVWAFAVIYCGHFPRGVRMFHPREVEGETRAGWYLRQILASANFEGSRRFHILSGHLSHQIEHHLFPDLPSCRYPDIAIEVRALCRAYGVPYNSGRFSHQLGEAIARVCRCALPPRKGPRLRRRVGAKSASSRSGGIARS